MICGKFGGFVTTNNGENFSYTNNSRNNKITEWRGEAYSKTKSENLILTADNKSWCLNKFADGGYIKYGQGFTNYVLSVNGFDTNCMSTIIDDGKSKIYLVNITNIREYEQNAKIDLILKIGS